MLELNSKGRWTLPVRKHPSRHTCVTPYCRRDPREGRRRCHKCNSKIYRANNPLMYAFHNLKHHAKQRGKEFLLTFEDLKAIINGTDYLARRGREALSLTFDRREPSKGYVVGNVRIITKSENSRRRFVSFYA